MSIVHVKGNVQKREAIMQSIVGTNMAIMGKKDSKIRMAGCLEEAGGLFTGLWGTDNYLTDRPSIHAQVAARSASGPGTGG